jgi:polysaccharide biosynthesis/export protein VpsN
MEPHPILTGAAGRQVSRAATFLDKGPQSSFVESLRMPFGTSRLLTLFLLMVAAAMAWADPAPDTQPGHTLHAGDKVRVAVFDEAELSVTERVSDRGTISYPLLGELQVAGLSPEELERLITSRLKGPYLVDPRVTVSIDEHRPFFVMGHVNRPGSYPYVLGLTVRKAISMAGGFTDRASRGKIFVVSEQPAEAERKVGEGDAIGPGDTVVVKESLF